MADEEVTIANIDVIDAIRRNVDGIMSVITPRLSQWVFNQISADVDGKPLEGVVIEDYSDGFMVRFTPDGGFSVDSQDHTHRAMPRRDQ